VLVFGALAGGARHPPPTAPLISREAAIRHLGKNPPEPLPAGMAEAVISSGQSFSDFAVAVTCLAVQAARREAAEIGAVALRIASSDLPGSNPHPTLRLMGRPHELPGFPRF